MASTPDRRALARVTVPLTPRTDRALDAAVQITGDTQTHVLNRALQVYAHLQGLAEQGWSVYLEDPATGERDNLILR